MENPIQLTPRVIQAADYARHVHVELRKGTQVPYMAHLLGVASLVLGETGHIGPHIVTEEMVIAALLHDAVEDEGGLPRLDDIEANFGKQVGKVVMRRSRTQKLLVFRALPIDRYEARVTRVSGQNRSLIN